MTALLEESLYYLKTIKAILEDKYGKRAIIGNQCKKFNDLEQTIDKIEQKLKG